MLKKNKAAACNAKSGATKPLRLQKRSFVLVSILSELFFTLMGCNFP
jgi:hypothetical protein